MKTKNLLRTILFCVLLVHFSALADAGEPSWKTRDGRVFQGDLVKFDLENKVAVIQSETQGEVLVPASELDYKARKRILFSGSFHRSFPQDWSIEQSNLLIYAVFTPAILFFIGMWIAGMVFARRWNPFKPFFAFFGSWLIGVVLMVCYFKFAAESPGSEKWILIVGFLVSALAVSALIAVIYRCKILTGFYIFISQFIFGILVGVMLLIWMEKKADPVWLDHTSEDYLFTPVGMVGKMVDPDDSGEEES